MSSQHRVPAGVRTGGQYAPGTHPASTVNLGGPLDLGGTVGTDSGGSLESPTPPSPQPAGSDDWPTDLVLQRRPDGTVSGQEHQRLGVPVDQPDGTPAQVSFHPDGSVASRLRAGARDGEHFPAGGAVSHVDPRDGSHVTVSPNDGGRCVRRGVIERYSGRSRPPTGASATWQPREPGFAELRDGPGGEPGVVYSRPDGSVSSLTRYRRGGWTHTVDFHRDGSVAVVFSNTSHRDVQGFPAGDPVWADVGLDGQQWAGTPPNEAVQLAVAEDASTRVGPTVPARDREPGADRGGSGSGKRLPTKPAGLRADQLDEWEGIAADWYGGG